MSRKRRTGNKLVSKKFKLRLRSELLNGIPPEEGLSKSSLKKSIKATVGKGTGFFSYLRGKGKEDIIELYEERIEAKREETLAKITADNKLSRERMEKQEVRRKQGIENKRQAA